jgi:hypothetical protein
MIYAVTHDFSDDTKVGMNMLERKGLTFST